MSVRNWGNWTKTQVFYILPDKNENTKSTLQEYYIKNNIIKQIKDLWLVNNENMVVLIIVTIAITLPSPSPSPFICMDMPEYF